MADSQDTCDLTSVTVSLVPRLISVAKGLREEYNKP